MNFVHSWYEGKRLVVKYKCMERPSRHVTAQSDHCVNALTTQLTGQAMLQLRLTNGAYSAEHLQSIATTSAA